jgi:hypothetical protein
MSDTTKNEFASALKWSFVIIVAIATYSNFAPNYYFMRQGNILYRGNKVTGSIEFLEDNEWVRSTESDIARIFRLERKKQEGIQSNKMKKRLIEAKNLPDDDDDV